MKIGWKKYLSSYFIRLYELDLYGSTQVESPICTQYRLGVRFVRACHSLRALLIRRSGPLTNTSSWSTWSVWRQTLYFNAKKLIVPSDKNETFWTRKRRVTNNWNMNIVQRRKFEQIMSFGFELQLNFFMFCSFHNYLTCTCFSRFPILKDSFYVFSHIKMFYSNLQKIKAYNSYFLCLKFM